MRGKICSSHTGRTGATSLKVDTDSLPFTSSVPTFSVAFLEIVFWAAIVVLLLIICNVTRDESE